MKAMLAISMCSMPHIQKPNTETVQIIEQQWSTRLNRGSAQRDGSGTPSTVEWQPLYPTLRVPGSNPQSLPELKAYHGLGRVELPGLALACAPSTSTQSAPATSVIVAPGGAYKFVGVPGKPEADSVLEWLCATGDAAVFVLKYRVPSVWPTGDAQQLWWAAVGRAGANGRTARGPARALVGGSQPKSQA